MPVVGLDIYVGSLSRYFLGDWETIIQQSAREAGEVVRIISAEPRGIGDDPKQVLETVLLWRATLEDDLRRKGSLPEPFDWPEEPGSPYFTDKPDWHCFGALVLLAAYKEAGVAIPSRLNDDWAEDPVLARVGHSASPAYWSLYFNELWFPIAKMSVFKALTPARKPVQIASVQWLRHHLEQLNLQTWSGSSSDLETWSRSVPAPRDADFVQCAQAGLAITTRLVREAESNRLPMLLDY